MSYAWLTDFGEVCRGTEHRRVCVDTYLALAAARLRHLVALDP